MRHFAIIIQPKGYTLIELLIVLVIMGMLMGLTTPRLMQMYDSVTFSLERDDVLFQLEGLPFAVYQRGQGLRLLEAFEAEQDSLLSLPEGWRLNENQTTDIVYNAMGFCSGGEATFEKGDRRLLVQFEAPMCRPIVL